MYGNCGHMSISHNGGGRGHEAGEVLGTQSLFNVIVKDLYDFLKLVSDG